MTLRRHKSRKAQVADRAKKATKGAKKAAKGTAVVKVAKRAPTRRLPPILAGAAAAVFVAIKATHRGGGEPASA